MRWHYLQDDQRLGPISDTELRLLIKTRAVSPEVLVWVEGMSNWQPYSTLNAWTNVAASTQRPALPPAPHSAQPRRTRTHASPIDVAPIGHRIVAKLIDYAALVICLVVLAIILQWVWSLVQQTAGTDKAAMKSIIRIAAVVVGLLLALFYRQAVNAADSSHASRSPGKRLMKLQVVDAHGRPIGFSTRFARAGIQVLMVGGLFFMLLFPLTAIAHKPRFHPPPPSFHHTPYAPPQFRRPADPVGRFFSIFLFSAVASQAGYLVALLNPQRRGLHDLLCGTRVIHRP
jgi:uncharacterized RDD family membrane protein YckC